MIGDEAAKASWKQILKSCNMLNFDFYPVAELVALAFSAFAGRK